MPPGVGFETLPLWAGSSERYASLSDLSWRQWQTSFETKRGEPFGSREYLMGCASKRMLRSVDVVLDMGVLGWRKFAGLLVCQFSVDGGERGAVIGDL